MHLTQSGVSQHIKNLEETLELKLFERIQRRLVPTPAAVELYDSCRKSMQEIQLSLDKIRGQEGQLRGRFRLAAPYEFGKNVLGPLLGTFLKEHMNLKLHLELGFSSDFLAPLLKGEIDAAVLDAFATHPSLQAEKIYEENLELCFAAHVKIPSPQSSPEAKREFLLSQRFVDYNQRSPIVDRWFRHHFGKIQGSPQVFISSGQTQIVADWVEAGLGAAILPHHFLQGENAKKFKSITIKKNPLKNALYIANLRGRSSPVLDEIKKSFKV